MLAAGFHAFLRNDPHRLIVINLVPPGLQNLACPGGGENQKLKGELARQAAVASTYRLDERWYLVIGQRRMVGVTISLWGGSSVFSGGGFDRGSNLHVRRNLERAGRS